MLRANSLVLIIASLLVLAGGSVSNAQAAPTPSEMQAQASAMASDPAYKKVQGHLKNAAAAIGRAKAAMEMKPAHIEAAVKEYKAALTWLVDATWQGADVEKLALQLVDTLTEIGGFHKVGKDHFEAVLSVLRVALKIRAETPTSTIAQDMGIRELVNALHNLIESGWHDSWLTTKALRWYISAAGSGTYLPDLIARLLAIVDAGDYSAEAQAQIAQMVRELYEKFQNGELSGRAYRDEIERIRQAIVEEGRRLGRERKARHRREVEEEEAREREQEAAKSKSAPVPEGDVSIILTPPIRPPEIVFQMPAPIAPDGPAAPSPMPSPPVTPTTPVGTPGGPPPLPTTEPGPRLPNAPVPPPTPAPTTPAPITPTPVTPAPVTPAPVAPTPPVTTPPPVAPPPIGPEPAMPSPIIPQGAPMPPPGPF